MVQAFFHAWERRLASVSTDRVVRPFDWGLDWIPLNGSRSGASPSAALSAFVSHAMRDGSTFFTPEPTTKYDVSGPSQNGERLLTFPSAIETPHRENNIVYGRWFAPRRHTRAAAVVLPQWNADAEGHVGLCRLLAMNGMAALRLSLPYHDRRMPPELSRADYIVSANVGRTLQVCRQAVQDARRAIAWLAAEGFDRIGILGTSLGSCLSLLTTAHEPLVTAQALNHISPHFADVVWRGLSTAHVRQGLDGNIDLEQLRELWKPISPRWYLDRLRDRRTLLVYARYDLSFPVDLSLDLVREFQERAIPHELAVLPCGHYSSGKAPFKFLDGWVLVRFLKKELLQRSA
jgi:hypothetical protein